MSKAKPDNAAPAALKALGGWASADWFCQTVLNDEDVVGLTLPKLPDVGAQSFKLVGRSIAPSAGGRRLEPATRKPPTQLAAKLGIILESAGASKTAAFRRTTLLFASAAVLFFAEFHAEKLKSRNANKLRRDLVNVDLLGCVLRAEGTDLTIMVWPAAENEITAFIDAALPPYPMHKEFREVADRNLRQSDTEGRGAAERPKEAAAVRRLERERKQLITQVQQLRAQVDELARSRPALNAIEQLGLDDAKLKSMLMLLHPDKHGNSEAANEAAKWVNGLREMLKAKAAP